MIENRLRAALDKSGIDAVLLYAPSGLFYVAGFSGTEAIVLASGHKTYVFTDFRYTEQAKKECKGAEIIEINRKTKWEKLRSCIKENAMVKIGFEEETLSVAAYKMLQEELEAELVPAGELLSSLRAEKEPHELAAIKESQAIAEAAFLSTLPLIKEGMPEIEIAAMLENEMRKRGAKKPSFDTIVASGVRGALPHGVASEKPVKKGELITMDFGCVYKGYCSDMTRTVALGTPTEQMKNIYEIVQTAHKIATEAGHYGITLKETDAVARNYITEKGYGKCFGHGLSHGIGIDIHEPLVFDAPLPINAVFSIEPGIYLQDIGGVRIENLVYMTENGFVCLNNTSTEMIIL